MNLREIRDEAWAVAREIGTTEATRLWSTKEMNRYINRVYRFIARETRCIRDARTTAVCRIAVTKPVDLAALTALAATDSWAADDLVGYNDATSWLHDQFVAPRVFPLHWSILDIDECKWLGVPWRLTKVSVTKWQNNPRWEQVVGYPTEYCTDYHTNYIALNFRTTTNDTLCLLVRRLPLLDLINDTDEPEFRINYHDFLLNGVLEQMYNKQDAETFDLAKAADFKIRFASDIDEIKQHETILDQRLKPNHSLSAFR
jgi:hypothetical protein